MRFCNETCHSPIKRSLLLHPLKSWQILWLFWPMKSCRNGPVPVPGTAHNGPGSFCLLPLGRQTAVGSVTNLWMTCCDKALDHGERLTAPSFSSHPSPGTRHISEDTFLWFYPWHLMAPYWEPFTSAQSTRRTVRNNKLFSHLEVIRYLVVQQKIHRFVCLHDISRAKEVN